MGTETNVSTERDYSPRYYALLYRQLKKELEKNESVYAPKWKRDIAVLLLERSLQKPAPNRKKLRMRVARELDRILDRNWKKVHR